MFSFCRKSKPNTSSFTRRKPHVHIFIHCREITEGRFPPRNIFFSHKLVFLHRHSVTSEMTNISRRSKTNSLNGAFFFSHARIQNSMLSSRCQHGFVYVGKWVSCSVFGCSNNSSPSGKCPGVGFHKLLPGAHLRRAWKMKLHRVQSSIYIYKLAEDENIRVCTLHFVPEDQERDLIVSGIFFR